MHQEKLQSNCETLHWNVIKNQILNMQAQTKHGRDFCLKLNKITIARSFLYIDPADNGRIQCLCPWPQKV